MTSFLNLYLREHPEAMLLSSVDEETRELLLKAQEKRYIVLEKAPRGEFVFTQEQLKQAKMWKEKGCLED